VLYLQFAYTTGDVKLLDGNLSWFEQIDEEFYGPDLSNPNEEHMYAITPHPPEINQTSDEIGQKTYLISWKRWEVVKNKHGQVFRLGNVTPAERKKENLIDKCTFKEIKYLR
jgi:hypothetical protein